MRYVFNDENIISSHGFYLLNSGGDFTRFMKNPVMLYDHKSDLSIGFWKNLRIEGSQLIADPDFDADDEAQKYAAKVERGSLKGLSVGMYINAGEWRVDALTGREELYITEWELVECSITPVPSNPNALVSLRVLDRNNQEIADVASYVKLSINTKSNMKINLTAAAMVALGLNADAEDTAISAAIERMAKAKADLSAENKVLEDKLKAINTEKVDTLMTLAAKRGVFTEDKLKELRAIAESNYGLAESIVNVTPEKTSLSGMVDKGKGVDCERDGWDYSQWKRNDPTGLNVMKTDNPKEYAALCAGKNRK